MQVEFIADTNLLSERFEKLLNRAHDIQIAVAWAGKPDEGVQDVLWRMRRKVSKLVVGCSLLNTNPDFLERWQGQTGFRVILDKTEVFHPKLYLFRVGRATYLFIGSSNLTGGGFEKNREANVLLRGSDAGPIAAAAKYIEERHNEGTKTEGEFWKGWLREYRSAWRKRQSAVKVTQGTKSKPTSSDKRTRGLEEWSFAEYFERLKAGNSPTNQKLTERLKFLADVRKHWSNSEWSLKRMTADERRLVAGTAKEQNAACFGTVGLGFFLHAVISDPAPIDRALSCIPTEGPVETRHWNKFRILYSDAFTKAGPGTASRLLCLWRPDVFFSANSGSVPAIAARFGLSQISLRTWDGYWEATKWLMQRPWVRGPKPLRKLEERCWHGRVALLDVLMYSEPKR